MAVLNEIQYKADLDESDVLEALDKIKRESEDAARAAERSFRKAGDAIEDQTPKIRRFADGMVTGFNQALEIGQKVGELIRRVGELIEESVTATRVEVAFLQLAQNVGQSGEEIINTITRASNGAISRFEAMKAANQALRLEVAKTPEEFEKLAKGSIALGRAGGVSAAEAFSRFVSGIGKRETELLDELGITTAEMAIEMERLAGELGKTVGQLSLAERQTIFTQAGFAVLDKTAQELGDDLQDVGSGFDKVKADAGNAKIEIGNLFTIVTTLLADLANAPGGLLDRIFGFDRDRSEAGLGGLAGEIENLQSEFINLVANIIGGLEGIKQAARTVFAPITLGFRAISEFVTTGSTDLFKSVEGAFKASGDLSFIGAQFKEGFERGADEAEASLKKRFKDILNPEPIKKLGLDAGKAGGEGLADGLDTSLADNLQKAKDRVNKAFADLARSAAERALQIQITQERRALDLLLDNARDREDIARKSADRIEDINRKAGEAIADQTKDLGREEQQIARDGQRRQAEIAQSAANRRVDIERDFRQQLESIRRTFEQSALEAERANDAQAFVRAVRDRDNSIADAVATRDSQVEEAKTSAQRQRAELKTELQNEIEDARIANRQKLEDLQLRFERELEAQRIRDERDLEEQAIIEARKEADRIERDARELADFDRQQQQKLERLNASLANEIELIAGAEQAKTAIIANETKRRVEIEQQAANRIANLQTVGGARRNLRGGIPVEAGLTPSFSPASNSPIAQRINNNSTTTTANVSMTPDVLSDPIMKQKLVDMVAEELVSGMKGGAIS